MTNDQEKLNGLLNKLPALDDMDELDDAALRLGWIMGTLARYQPHDPRQVSALYQKILSHIPAVEVLHYVENSIHL